MSVRTWLERLATSRYSYLGLGFASILESTIIPIPLETILIPLLQTNRHRLWRLATAAVFGCIIGAVIGYGVGYFLFESLGQWIVDTIGNSGEFSEAVGEVNRQGFWFVLTVGVSPVPFQIAMIAAGVVGYSILGFVLSAAISRAIRYYGLALLVQVFGEKAEILYRKHKTATLIILTILVVGIWIAWFLW